MSEIGKREEEKRTKIEVPEKIEIFKDCAIFNEEKFSKRKEAIIGKLTIGDVKINDDKRAALCLHPNFAIQKCLEEEKQERDVELGLTKLRLEAQNREEKEKIGNIEYEVSEGKRIRLEIEAETREKEKERDIMDAKEHQIYDPVHQVFDFSKRRVTDMKENSIFKSVLAKTTES